jgi:CBS domain-containing protein
MSHSLDVACSIGSRNVVPVGFVPADHDDSAIPEPFDFHQGRDLPPVAGCAHPQRRVLNMKARDVMVAPVITVKATALVKGVAQVLIARGISAVPVVDNHDKLVGILSEGDLMHRAETGTERRISWWMRLFTSDEMLAADYVKAHARKVADVMTRDVITATPETPLHEIATLMEKHSVKRIPILENGGLVGIVTRANLVQVIASAGKGLEVPLSDAAIRDKLMAHLGRQPWTHTGLLNITVSDGIVDLWGITESEAERKAIVVAAEGAPGVSAVHDHMTRWRVQSWQ